MSGRCVATASKYSSTFHFICCKFCNLKLQNCSALLKSAALCFITATYFLIIPYFRRHSLMFCRRRFSQVCTSLPVTQKMSSAVLKKCQASNFCGVLVGNKTQTGAETLNYLHVVVPVRRSRGQSRRRVFFTKGYYCFVGVKGQVCML